MESIDNLLFLSACLQKLLVSLVLLYIDEAQIHGTGACAIL